MQLHLRFGMHSDIPIIHQEEGLLDGIVVPAHILAYQEAAVSVFVTSLRIAYIIDPMTFMLQHESTWGSTEDDLRPSVRRMCEDYYDGLLSDVTHGSGGDPQPLEPERLDMEALCDGVSSFQLRKVEESAKASTAEKYLERYQYRETKTPRLVLAPYFYFREIFPQL